jgi:hypothetical protein
MKFNLKQPKSNFGRKFTIFVFICVYYADCQRVVYNIDELVHMYIPSMVVCTDEKVSTIVVHTYKCIVG